MKKKSKNICLVWLFILLLLVSGCTARRRGPLKSSEYRKEGIYHKVQKKETFWSIAKVYDLSVEQIARANNIPNAAQIQENQLIFIPGAGQQKRIIINQVASLSEEFDWPVKGSVIAFFGNKNSNSSNNGIDIRSKFGQNVYASKGGKVVFADYVPGYEKTVMIDHGDGYLTVYGQNSDIIVSVGDVVVSKTPIAKVGKKDSLAFVHFEIRKDSIASNPLYFLP